jgi:Uma2 family endonuclease
MTYAEYLAAEAKSEVRHEYLREYVLVSQAEPLVEVYRRAGTGRWELLEARSGETIDLASLGVSLDVAAIYANPPGQAAGRP